MLERVAENIVKNGLFTECERVLLAVSGGVDSMALLAILSRLAIRYSWELGIAHVNHQLRGAESDGDLDFVRGAAGKLNLPFFSRNVAVQAHASEHRVSIEMAARQLRFKALGEAANEFGARKIALAHHSDDQVELFWMRLLRGNAGEGLRGMKWINRFPLSNAEFRNAEFHSLKVVRPLLNISRSEIVEFARREEVVFREDSTNAMADYERNRMRLEVLPRLRESQSSLNEVTTRLMEVLGAEKDWLRTQAQHWLQSDAENFRELHLALQREIIVAQTIRLGVEPSFELVERLRTRVGEKICVGENRFITLDGNGVLIQIEPAQISFDTGRMEINVSRPGIAEFGGRRIEWRQVAERGSEPGVEYFDAERLGGRVWLRHWGAGDRMQPIGMAESVKLQDLFTNARVSQPDRHRKIVGVSEGGEIFWVEGLRIGEKFKVGPETRRVLAWSWRRI